MKTLLATISANWCRWMHGRPMRPVNGTYRCAECLRLHPVPWEQEPAPRSIAIQTEAEVEAA